MSVIDDALSAILKGANPSASDEDISSQVEGLKKSGGEAVSQALNFIPGLNSVKDIATNAMPLATEAAKTPTGAAITSALSGGPVANGVPNPGNPVSDVSQGIVAGLSNTPMPSPAPSPVPTPPPAPAPEPSLTPAPAAPPAPAATAKPAEDNSIANALSAPSSNDAEARAADDADAAKKRKLSTLPIAIAGVGDAIASGAHAFGVNAPTDKQEKLVELAKKNFDESRQLFDEKLKNDPNSDISKSYRTMVTQIAPNLANNPNFQNMSAKAIGDKLPLIDTVMKAQANKDAKELGNKQTEANKEIALGERKDQFEQRAVNQGLARIASIRGDASLARTELQRDAAITAVNRINEVHAAGKELNPVDYADILSQTYKARSGTAPDQQIMKDIHQPIGSATFNRAWTYLTGKQAPATSRDISNSLLDIATSMGHQADKMHDAYMQPHLVKPAGVSDSAWEPVKQTGRGMSFADATKQSEKTTTDATKTIGGKTYVSHNGQWYESQ